MAKFRKKPVVIEAVCFETNNETDDKNMNAVCIWANQGRSPDETYCWHNGTNIFIKTLEGVMRADVKDWIIRGVKGELYPCKPDIFAATYDPVVEASGAVAGSEPADDYETVVCGCPPGTVCGATLCARMAAYLSPTVVRSGGA